MPDPIDPDEFILNFKAAQAEVHATARKSGWWEDRDALVEIATRHSPELGEYAQNVIAGNGIALKQSELSEALENIRHGYRPDDKIPEFTGEEAEYADTIIRIMDTAEGRGLRVAEAIIAKMAMNKTREYKHGGKKC